MNFTTKQIKESATKIIDSINAKCVINKFIPAYVIWISPFNTVEYRVGYFEEFSEAQLFAKNLKKEYGALNMVHSVYIFNNLI